MKKLISNIIVAIIPIVLAILMLLYPAEVVKVFFTLIAVYMLLGALRELYALLSFEQLSLRVRTFGIIKNVINLIFAVVIIFLTFNDPELMMEVVVYVIAVDLILTALSDILDYVMLYRLGYRGIPALDVVLKIVLAICMFFFPTFISDTFIKAVAIIILIFAFIYILSLVISYFRHKDDEIVIEYEEKR